MPDWRQYLRARLGPLGLHHDREEEILTALAEHLEDQCATAQAEKAILPKDWVGPMRGWHRVDSACARIRHAEEETMSPTAKTLWVPGVSMLFCSFILLLVDLSDNASRCGGSVVGNIRS